MMKKILFFILMVHFIMPVQAQRTLRILSYNIKNANGMDGFAVFSVSQMSSTRLPPM